MVTKKFHTDRRGLAPLIGIVLSLAIVFLIAASLFSVFFGNGIGDNVAPAPIANLQASSLNSSVLKIEHLGGETLSFSPALTTLILETEGKSYHLAAESFGSLEPGDTKLLALKTSDGTSIRVPAGAQATLKVVDLETKKPVFTQKVRFGPDSGTVEADPAPSYQLGLYGTYYSNLKFKGPAVIHNDSKLCFANKNGADWYGFSSIMPAWPDQIIGKNNTFGVIYEGFLLIEKEADYTFYLTSDDGSWLWIDGNLVINNEGYHIPLEKNKTLSLSPGYHPIKCKMFQGNGGAVLHLEWESPYFVRCFVTGYSLP